MCDLGDASTVTMMRVVHSITYPYGKHINLCSYKRQGENEQEALSTT